MSMIIIGSLGGSKNDDRQVVEVESGITSAWYLIPQGTLQTSVECIPAGTAKVQYSSDIEGAKAGSAVGIDWPADSVTAPAMLNINGGNICVRVVSATGAAKMIINRTKA